MESSNTDIDMAIDSMTSEQCEERVESIDEIYRTYNASRKMQIGRTSSGTLTLKSSQNDDVEGNGGNNINNNDQDEATIENILKSKKVIYDEIESDRDNKICVAMASKPFRYSKSEDFKSRQTAKLPANRIVSGQVTKRHQSGKSSSCTTTFSNANTMQYSSSNEFRQSKNSVRFADENYSSGANVMGIMSAHDYYSQQIAMAYGNYPQARAGPGSGEYQYPTDQAEMFTRSQYMTIPSQSDSASGCNGRHQYHRHLQPPVVLQHHHGRKESGESSSLQHNQQDICSEACTAQSGDYTSHSCAEISKSNQESCNDICNDPCNDTCNSLQTDCPDRSDKQSCQSRLSFSKINPMQNSYSSQDCIESMGYTFCEQSASCVDPTCCSYPPEYCYGSPVSISHCAQSSPMTYEPQQMATQQIATQQMVSPCQPAPYCWPMQSSCPPMPTCCPVSPVSCYIPPTFCMPPCCCPEQERSTSTKDSVNIQTIYSTDYRGICGNQFNHFPNAGTCGICTNCSACMGIVSRPSDDGPETCGPCKGSCIFTGTNGFCSMAYPTSSYHKMFPSLSGCSHKMTQGSSHQISPGSSHQISRSMSPGSSHQLPLAMSPSSSRQLPLGMSPSSSHQMSLAMSPSSSHQMNLAMSPSSSHQMQLSIPSCSSHQMQLSMPSCSSHQMQMSMPSCSTLEMSPMMSQLSSNNSFQMPPRTLCACTGMPQMSTSMSPTLSPTHSFQMQCTPSNCGQNYSNSHLASGSSGIPMHYAPSWPAQAYEMPEDGGFMPGPPLCSHSPMSKAKCCDVRTMNR